MIFSWNHWSQIYFLFLEKYALKFSNKSREDLRHKISVLMMHGHFDAWRFLSILGSHNLQNFWYTVFSVSNCARLSLQLFWNISSYLKLARLSTSIWSVEIILLRLADSTFSHSSSTKLHQKLKSIFIKRRNKKKSLFNKKSECEDPKCPWTDWSVNLSRDTLTKDSDGDRRPREKQKRNSEESWTSNSLMAHLLLTNNVTGKE